MFLVIPSPVALESTVYDFCKQRQVETFGSGYCFYFRFVGGSGSDAAAAEITLKLESTQRAQTSARRPS